MAHNTESTANTIVKEMARAKLKNLGLLLVIVALAAWTLVTYKQLETKEQELANANLELQKKKDDIVSASEALENVLNSSSLGDEAKTALRRLENSKYFLGYYAWRIPWHEYEKARRFLKNQGYPIRQKGYLETPTSFLAKENTIFYYDDRTKRKAQSLADDILNLTGSKFSVRKGGGVGLIKGQEQWQIVIHIVGSGGWSTIQLGEEFNQNEYGWYPLSVEKYERNLVQRYNAKSFLYGNGCIRAEFKGINFPKDEGRPRYSLNLWNKEKLGYEFYISKGKVFTVYKRFSTELPDPVRKLNDRWEKSKKISEFQNNINQLKICRSEKKLTFLVNDSEVFSYSDPQAKEYSHFGWNISTGTSVHFRKLEVCFLKCS